MCVVIMDTPILTVYFNYCIVPIISMHAQVILKPYIILR